MEDFELGPLFLAKWTGSPQTTCGDLRFAPRICATLRGVRPGWWREKVYKYMRIYLWSDLRMLDLRMRDLTPVG
jgi:hypothetical protein